jgi:hypothetical protein
METGDRDLVGCDHVENAFAARDRQVFDVVEPSRPLGLLDRYDIVIGDII